MTRAERARAARDGDPPVVGFVSLGCAKNLVDSEKMLGQIAEAGAVITGDESVADTIVVNTCGFLDAARQEALDVIRELAERKRRGALRRIVVAGCLVQRDGEKLREIIPEIDALVGVHNRDDVARAVVRSAAPTEPGHAGLGGPARQGRAGVSPALGQATRDGTGVPLPTLPQPLSKSLYRNPGGRASGPSPDRPEVGPPGRLVRRSKREGSRVDLHLGDYHPRPWSDRGRLRLTPRHYAYVRISEGCDQKCTFCTIPSIRGPLHSKPPDAIVAECRELIADGARELVLIGQDTTSYGRDLGYEPGLAGLLRTLDAACDGARWLRLMYAYPSIFTDEMIDTIAACDRVVKYIDLPLQHINDRVLKAMARRVTRRRTEALLEKLRRRIPGVTIRTTFIVGFPGETDAEFAELLAFVRDFGFDALGAFRYSHEPETPAGRMKHALDDAVRQERYERLMETQREVARAAARRRIGHTFDVVVDERRRAVSVARHAGQAPEVDSVCRLAGGPAEPGDWVPVVCTDSDGYDLVVQPRA